jgi:hypothetical protein
MLVIRDQLDIADCAVVFAIRRPRIFISALYGMFRTLLVVSHVPAARPWVFAMFNIAPVAFS